MALDPPATCLSCQPEPRLRTGDSPTDEALDMRDIRSAGQSCRDAVADCAEWAASLPKE